MVMPAWGTFQTPEPEERERQAPRELEEDEKQPIWGDFQNPNSYQGKINENEEGPVEYLARNAAAWTSRLGEQYFGRLGNYEKMLNQGIGWAMKNLMGEENFSKMEKKVEESLPFLPKELYLFPSSEKLKEASEQLTGGYTKPKTKGEEKVQGIVEDVGSTITGRGIRNPNLRDIAINNFTIPAVANVGKIVAEDAGFSENTGNTIKTAIWFPLALWSGVNGGRYASNLMNQARNGYNRNVQVDVNRYQNNLNRAANQMLHNDPGSALAQQQIAGIRQDLANGQTSILDLFTRYDAINRAKRDRGLFALNPTDRAAAIRNINEVRDLVRAEIEQIGQANPQALRNWQNGVLAWSTIHRSRALGNWVESLVKGPHAKILSGPALALFGVGSAAATKAPLIAGPSAYGAPAVYKTAQIGYRMIIDPTLRRYYYNAISAALNENAPAFVSNYVKLNERLKKSQSAEPESKSKK
jgi:hypothetical protein